MIDSYTLKIARLHQRSCDIGGRKLHMHIKFFASTGQPSEQFVSSANRTQIAELMQKEIGAIERELGTLAQSDAEW